MPNSLSASLTLKRSTSPAVATQKRGQVLEGSSIGGGGFERRRRSVCHASRKKVQGLHAELGESGRAASTAHNHLCTSSQVDSESVGKKAACTAKEEKVAFSDPGAAQTLPSSARFYACFAPPRCKGATLGRSARGQAHSGPGESFLGRFSLALRSKGHRSAPRGPTGVGSSLPVCRTPFPRQPKRGGLRSPTALGSFSTADGGEFYDSDRYSTGRGSGDGSGMEGETPGQSDSVGQAREEEGEKPAAAEDTSKRKPSWYLRIFGMEHQEEKVWKVPWTGTTIFQVMFLWFAAFWLVGSWGVPAAAHALGFNRASFTYRGQAVYSLVTDLAEMLVGLGILMRCLARFRPRVAAGWFWFFPFKWSLGFWILDTAVGCLLFPIVNMLSQINTELLPLPGSFPGGSPIEQSLSAKDPIANLLYVVVVSVCAPIWEEIIFRGFLLASLTRYMPMWGSVSVSALVFALAHFSLQRLLPLSFLGIVMGVIFVRSRNLLACMVLHSMWNAFVFLELLR